MTVYDYAGINQNHAEDPFSAERYRQMASRLPRVCGSILDYGCARGFGGAILRCAFPEASLTGFDCCATKIAQLPMPPYTHGIVGTHLALIEGKTFDGIVAGEVIEHFCEDDVEPFLQVAYRLLNRQGRLVMTTPNPGYVKLHLTGGSVTDWEAHQTAHPPSVLARRMEQAGFHSVSYTGTGRVSSLIGAGLWTMLPSLYGSYIIWGEK